MMPSAPGPADGPQPETPVAPSPDPARVARVKGMRVLGLTGRGGGRLAPACDVCIRAPADETYRIPEYHLPIYHPLCLMLEDTFYPG